MRVRHFWEIFDRDKTLPVLLILPVVVVLVAMTVFPFAYNVWMSLHRFFLTSPEAPRWIGGTNYVSLILSDGTFWYDLLRTGYFSGAAVGIELTFGMAIALLMNREFRGRNLLRVFLMFPLVATPVAAVYVWRMMFNPSLGVINYFLKAVGLPAPGWLSNPQVAMSSIILVDVWQWTPFVALILLAGLLSMPREPFEAARVDGCSPLQTFWHITLPLLKALIGIAVVLRLIDSFKTFDIIWGLTGGGPVRSTEIVNIYTYLTAFNALDIGYACALTIVMLVIVIVISIILVRRLIVAELRE